MGVFFGDNHKRISHLDFEKILGRLREHGFTEGQIGEVKAIFYGDLNESGEGAGISRDEFHREIKWLKEHPEAHHFTPHQVSHIEEFMLHYL